MRPIFWWWKKESNPPWNQRTFHISNFCVKSPSTVKSSSCLSDRSLMTSQKILKVGPRVAVTSSAVSRSWLPSGPASLHTQTTARWPPRLESPSAPPSSSPLRSPWWRELTGCRTRPSGLGFRSRSPCKFNPRPAPRCRKYMYVYLLQKRAPCELSVPQLLLPLPGHK